MPSFKPLHLSGPARRDIAGISAYTEQQWGAEQKRTYLNQLRNAFKMLQASPEIGSTREDIDQGLRAYLVGSHIIFYRSDKDVLSVVRVLHQSMDATRHLSPSDD